MAQAKLEIIADPDKPSFTTRRVVHAPRSLVFDAFTKPEHLKRWMGPRSLTFVTCEQDLRVGGSYRFVYRAEGGQEVAFHGVFREIVWPERIARTFVFEPQPDHEAEETLLLEEQAGETTITTTTVHKTLQGRDGHLAEGRAEAGMTEGYARLDELLSSLQNDKKDPIEDVRQGLGLLFRAAKSTLEKLPTKDFENAVVTGAREMGRVIENVGKTIERDVFHAKGSETPPPKPESAAKPEEPKPPPTSAS